MNITPFASLDVLSPLARAAWLEQLTHAVAARLATKYRSGAKEHKSDLGAVPVTALLDEMESEALDQIAYVNELRRRLGVGILTTLTTVVCASHKMSAAAGKPMEVSIDLATAAHNTVMNDPNQYSFGFMLAGGPRQ